MQYPATIDNWIDQSGITAQPIVEADPRPIFLTAAAFDRGTEKITRIWGDNFYKMYGYYINFDKYGQAALQAANIINNGGELLIKRIVAKDATLANIVIVGRITPDRVHKTDPLGNPLYIDPNTQKEVTVNPDGTYERAMVNVARLNFDLVTITGKKTMNEIIAETNSLIEDEEDSNSFAYPLMVITDNGRGVSTKRFGIEPQYALSKTQNFMIYRLKYLGSEDLDAESTYFCLCPGIVYLNESMDLDMACGNMIQCDASALNESIQLYYEKISEISGIDIPTLFKYDCLFARDNKGDVVLGLSLDESSPDLSVGMGFGIESGSNGSFGDCPINTDEYEDALLEFYRGEFNDDIYNLDMYKPDVCVDANYPYNVKKAIYELAKFRKDFFYFGDLGLDVNTYENAVNKIYEMPNDKFTAWYGQNYQIKNPFDKKNITVTITYSLAAAMIDQLNTRRNAPYCGILHKFTFPEVIEGTINFTPKITPIINQKTILDELHLNYASILEDVLTMETEFTSQTELTQLSFINNVIAIQAIVKDVRTTCPRIRYNFITSNDLVEYKTAVSECINKYSSWFESLEFVYVQDDIMKANKIFEASLRVTHRDFVQSEILNIYTLATDQATKADSDTSYNPYIDD